VTVFGVTPKIAATSARVSNSSTFVKPALAMVYPSLREMVLAGQTPKLDDYDGH
jgi:hypothetical protein